MLPAILLALFLIVSGGLLHGARLRIRPETLLVDGLSDDADGYRIVFLSDLHDRRFAPRLLKAVCAAKPDVILLGGDMYGGRRSPDDFYALLSALTDIAPVLFVEGNHDLHPGRRATEQEHTAHLAEMVRRGAVNLDGGVWYDSRGIEFRGVGWFSPRVLPTFSGDFPGVLLCHDPALFDLPGDPPALTLAGHVHGGFIKLPFIGPLFCPGNGAPIWRRFFPPYLFPKYSEGFYSRQAASLYVGRGLGFSVLPFRFIPAEIPVITLKKREKTKKFIK